tara:strand:- start:59 stop:283 length:225 start_codon:yes stop_codon:yes gene_type:complete
MNDLLNDIRTLERMETSFNKVFSTSKNVERDNAINDVYFLIRQMKTEKQIIVDRFEQEAPKDIQDLCTMIRGGK